MKVLVTGAAGFIGYHLCKKCIENNFPFIGIDNLNSYYDKNLKINRLEELKSFSESKKKEFNFKKIDLQDKSSIEEILPSSIIIDESLTIFLLLTSIYDDVYIIVDVCAEEINKSARKYILRIYKF